jgi:transaldolase
VAIEMAANAGDSAAILAGARRLSEAVQRENVLIRVAASRRRRTAWRRFLRFSPSA